MPAFADTNVIVYAFAKDDAKIAVAEGMLEKQPTISVQVISGTSVELSSAFVSA
ncbi:MAG: hypothetical protein HY525_18560 [Betaproteobacteria bacterium]|nr:hypothetical protein [Betaproteobacteria bacterium]